MALMRVSKHLDTTINLTGATQIYTSEGATSYTVNSAMQYKMIIMTVYTGTAGSAYSGSCTGSTNYFSTNISGSTQQGMMIIIPESDTVTINVNWSPSAGSSHMRVYGVA